MAGEIERRDPDTGELVPSDEPVAVFEVEVLGGVEGERLQAEQAQMVCGVLMWLVQNPAPDRELRRG
jgi:hypothetical protein